MDAHTLNAWTRFALQKGGIGSATALVDNPATDIEDLMFMAGEQITVLRRLDDETSSLGDPSSIASSADVPDDDDAGQDVWYLGYCEGVVGRFRASHVQIHGKLKKPVLMRRSGVGAIRDSTLRPMNKSEAAAMPASQVPPGIPVNAVDADDEERRADTVHDETDTTVVDHKRGSDAVAMYQSLATPSAPVSYDDGQAETAAQHARDSNTPNTSRAALPASASQTSNTAGRSLGADMQRLSITTPPLSDETHARAQRQRQRQMSHNSDSDDSETHLPWARDSIASDNSVQSPSPSIDATSRGADDTAPSSDPYATTPTKLDQGLHPLQTKGLHAVMSSVLPPSPISSAESQLLSRPNAGASNMYIPAPLSRGAVVKGSGSSHKGRSESTDTTTTDSSTDGPQRGPNTFSIYDIYGRDSVAMPNFEFRQLNGGKTNSLGARLASARGSESVASSSRSTPSSPQIPQQYLNKTSAQAMASMQGADASQSRSNPALRVASQRRPMAAPPVGMPPPTRGSIDSDSHSSGPGGHGAVAGHGYGQHSTSGSGPELPRPPPNLGAIRKASNAGQLSASGSGSLRSPREDAFRTGSNTLQQQASHPALGTNLLARRMREGSMPSLSGEGPDGLRITVPDTGSEGPMSGPSRPFAQMPNGLPSPTGSAHTPNRASSERFPDRERMGSLPSRKNSSIPQPGSSHLPGLTPPVSSLSGGHSGDHRGRSPSPLSGASGSSARSPHSPVPGLQTSYGSSPRPSLSIQTPTHGMSPYMPRPSPQMASPRGMQGPPGQSVLSPGGSGRPITPTTPSMRQPDVSQLKFDELGFVRGSGPMFGLPRDDVDDIDRWRHVLQENDTPAAKKSRKVRKMVEKGIPHASRPAVWPFLLQSTLRRRKGLFEELCKTSQSTKGKKGKEEVYAQIEKDIDRAYPDHKMFIGERRTGQADLEAILKAYVHYNPKVGYVQGLNLVAGFFLILMPAEDAFWMLCALLRDTHIEGYYAEDMKQVHVDGIVFGNLLHSMDPELTTRLQELDLEPINFAPAWILPMFVRILPWPTLLRVWDMYLFEGAPWVLRVSLAIIRVLRDPLMDRRVCPGHGEALRLLLHPPQQILTPENVIPCALSVKLKDGEVRKLSRNASKVVRQTNIGGVSSPTSHGPPSAGPMSAMSMGPPHDSDRSRSAAGSSNGHEIRSPSAMSSQRGGHQIV